MLVLVSFHSNWPSLIHQVYEYMVEKKQDTSIYTATKCITIQVGTVFQVT